MPNQAFEDAYYGRIPTHLAKRPSLTPFYDNAMMKSEEDAPEGYHPGKQRDRETASHAAYLAEQRARPEDFQTLEPLERRIKAELKPGALDNLIRAGNLRGSNPADDAAAREQRATAQRADPVRIVRDAAEVPLSLASFVPGPVGVGAGAVLGLGGAIDAFDEEASGGERAMGTGMAALGALPAMRALRGAPAVRTGTGASGSFRAFPKAAGKANKTTLDHQSSIPAVQHYWDALDLGQNPAKAAKIAAGRDTGSLEALKSLQEAGKDSRALRSMEVVEDLPVEQLAPSADEAADLIGSLRANARSVPTSRSKAVSAKFIGTQSPLNDGDESMDLYNLIGGDREGSTVDAETLRALGVPLPASTVSAPSLQGMRSPTRQSALNTLAQGEAASAPPNGFVGHTLSTRGRKPLSLYERAEGGGPFTSGPDQPLSDADLRPLLFEGLSAPPKPPRPRPRSSASSTKTKKKKKRGS